MEKKKKTRNTVGCNTWYFGLNEDNIANKLSECIKKVFDFNTQIKKNNKIILVKNRNNPLSRLFVEFGKKDKKHLPDKYLCGNENYLLGLFNGLIDSDGSIDNGSERLIFYNTSKKLIELFMFLCYKFNGYYPSCSIREPSAGRLKNCNIENCKEGYACKTVKDENWFKTNNNLICRIYDSLEETDLFLPTYDIEVDCPTHSFIANNVIVHNSICETRLNTGCGVPLFHSLMECSLADCNHDTKIISDGGCKFVGDMTKAFCAGADFIMTGSLLAGTDECPDSTRIEGSNKRVYQGMASLRSASKVNKSYSIEGISTTVSARGLVANVVSRIIENLKSGFSYVGANNLFELRTQAEFIRQTSAGRIESDTHIRFRE